MVGSVLLVCIVCCFVSFCDVPEELFVGVIHDLLNAKLSSCCRAHCDVPVVRSGSVLNVCRMKLRDKLKCESGGTEDLFTHLSD